MTIGLALLILGWFLCGFLLLVLCCRILGELTVGDIILSATLSLMGPLALIGIPAALAIKYMNTPLFKTKPKP
jgi:hypothetical protein